MQTVNWSIINQLYNLVKGRWRIRFPSPKLANTYGTIQPCYICSEPFSRYQMKFQPTGQLASSMGGFQCSLSCFFLAEKVFMAWCNWHGSTNILVELCQQNIGAIPGAAQSLFGYTLPIQSAGVSGKRNRIIPRWRPISEAKERRSPQCELKTKHLPYSWPLLFLIAHYL